jgi:hypothetical protein
MRAAAMLAAVLGLVMLYAAAVDGGPGPEPIPLTRSRIATPVSSLASTMSSGRATTPRHVMSTSVHFPHTPPIRSTPMFVPVDLRSLPMSNWHRQTLLRWYTVEQREPEMGAK